MKFTLKPQHNQASAITDGFMLLKSPLLNKPARLEILTCRSLPDLKVATDPLILVRYPKIFIKFHVYLQLMSIICMDLSFMFDLWVYLES